MTNLDKWSILAGLRFLLASVVAVTHLAVFLNLGWFAFLPRFGAFEAILGFLLISGYSITISYQKEPERFILRRFLRIYPIYLASIVITLLVSTLTLHEPLPTAVHLVLNFLFLNQLFTSTSFVGPAWSLSLEFWLYCLAPALMLVQPKWTRALVYLSYASFLLYTAGRTFLHLPYFAGVGYGANLLLLSFMWVAGLRLARERDNPGPVLWDIRLMFAGHLALGAAIALGSRWKHHAASLFFTDDVFTYALQAVTLGVVYVVFSRYVLAPAHPGRQRSEILRFLGDLSFPLYLINLPIYIFLAKTPLKSASAWYLIVLTASAALYWSLDAYSKRRHLKIQAA